MIDNDELNHLLRSMPQQQAPDDLEPNVMRRIAAMKRRALVGVRHAAARKEWVGGMLSAAAAGVIVAGLGLLLQDGSLTRVSRTDVAPRYARTSEAHRTPSAAAPAAGRRNLMRRGVGGHLGGPIVDVRVTNEIEQPTTVAPRSSSQRRTTPSVNARRRHFAPGAGIAIRAAAPIDTIAAARVRARGTNALPGAVVDSDATGRTVSRPTDETSGAGTGDR